MTTKVMIVDDEILAINHIKKMIDWQQAGFSIVSEATNPRIALDLLEQTHPDVIFVDIRMPVMNGLEFSKKALSYGYPVKIVLLTSYKDFEYAKEAINIGIFDYLVKHEVRTDTLLAVLSKIRLELEREKIRESMIRRQLLNDILSGRLSAEQRTSPELEAMRSLGEQFVFLRLKPDRPFPVISFHEKKMQVGQIQIESFSSTEIAIVEILPLIGEDLGILLACSKVRSQKQLNDLLFAFSRELQKQYSYEKGESASTIVSFPFSDLFELNAVAKQTERFVHKTVFFGKNQFIQLQNLMMAPNLACDSLKFQVSIIENQLDSADADTLGHTVEEAFHIVSKYHDIDLLQTLCRNLIEILNQFRGKHHMIAIEDLLNQGLTDCSRWFTVEGIRDWFMGIFKDSLHEARRRKTSEYSRKVRQTVDYIQINYAEDLTAEGLAEKLAISGDRLRHLFKEETGQTILEYITGVRMEQSKRLLADGRYKIYEIADMVGYRSSQYFSQVFRKMTGMTPLDYLEGKSIYTYENED